jgi:hypothetical protein
VTSASTIRPRASAFDRALDRGAGIIRLAPAWVARTFCTPGRRLRLHPDDYFPFGVDRGGIDERWLASTVRADNGPRTGPYEGLSLVVDPDGGLLPFDEFVVHHGAGVLGERLWAEHRGWPMYAKFFDNQQALPFHVHHRDEHAALVGKPGKPEAYYYPPQMNGHLGDQPISFLGLRPEVTRERFLERLSRFAEGGDNRITELSLGHRTRVGTGWDIPAGVLHAPASACTYEPQAACDIFCMCESWSNDRAVPEELMWKDVPADRRGDLGFIADLVDWERNTDPAFVEHRFMEPRRTARSSAEPAAPWRECLVAYRSPAFGAKELVVAPGGSATLDEPDSYGAIVIAGRGTVSGMPVAAANSIRYGQLTEDEYFVSAPAARAGVTVANPSSTDDLVILQHLGPGTVDASDAR